MNRMAKVGVALGGYLAAVLAGIVAAWWYDVRVSALPYDTSGGMYAGGQLLTSLAAFFVVALIPTVLGLWFIRKHEGVWNAVAIAAITFAAAGLLAVAMTMAGPPRNGLLMLVELMGLAQLLGVPIWLGAFALFAAIAPAGRPRRHLLVAAAIEVVIGGCAIVHWFGPRSGL